MLSRIIIQRKNKDEIDITNRKAVIWDTTFDTLNYIKKIQLQNVCGCLSSDYSIVGNYFAIGCGLVTIQAQKVEHGFLNDKYIIGSNIQNAPPDSIICDISMGDRILYFFRSFETMIKYDPLFAKWGFDNYGVRYVDLFLNWNRNIPEIDALYSVNEIKEEFVEIEIRNENSNRRFQIMQDVSLKCNPTWCQDRSVIKEGLQLNEFDSLSELLNQEEERALLISKDSILYSEEVIEKCRSAIDKSFNAHPTRFAGCAVGSTNYVISFYIEDRKYLFRIPYNKCVTIDAKSNNLNNYINNHFNECFIEGTIERGVLLTYAEPVVINDETIAQILHTMYDLNRNRVSKKSPRNIISMVEKVLPIVYQEGVIKRTIAKLLYRELGKKNFVVCDNCFIHGDLHLNNIRKLEHVVFIDWENSGMGDPMRDFSFFLWNLYYTEAYEGISKWLKVYYSRNYTHSEYMHSYCMLLYTDFYMLLRRIINNASLKKIVYHSLRLYIRITKVSNS